jgi:shikimate dehydrogenase
MGVPYAEVIGDPIAHSKSPLIHRFWLSVLGIKGDYRAVRVTPEELAGYLELRRADQDWRGCNVSMPLKEAALRLVHLDPTAKRIGALNTLIHYGDGRILGTNTDTQGFHSAVDLDRLQPKRVAVIGAGGAARAVLHALSQTGVPYVVVVNRTDSKAGNLLEAFDLVGDVASLGSSPDANLLVNASPLGMQGYPPLEIDLSNLSSDATVFDMVYEPLRTPLLEEARRRGLTTIDGLTMLIEQAAMAFACFFKDSPEQADTPELRELLTR